MDCFFCKCDEPDSIKPNGEKRKYNPPQGFDFICSRCVQVLLRANQEEIERAYNKAIKLGYEDKAKYLQSMMEENTYVRKTEITKRNMVRKRIGREARPTRNQIRT